MQFNRRQVIAGAASCVAASAVSTAFAQNRVTLEEKIEYARVFRVGEINPKELDMLLSLQEMATPTPKTIDALAQHFKEMAAPYSVANAQGTYQYWHQIAMDLTAFDHATNNPPKNVYAEQFGPTRSSRAMAIFHLALFEAVNLVFKKYESYKGFDQAILQHAGYAPSEINETTTSYKRAVHAAALTTLRFLYPRKDLAIEEAAARWLIEIRDPPEMQHRGHEIGVAVATIVWIDRQLDGSHNTDDQSPLAVKEKPLEWGRDPVSELPPALGSSWHLVKPFVIANAQDFLPKKPPALGDADFDTDYADVRDTGGDRDAPDEPPHRGKTASKRVGELSGPLDDTNETFKGIYWAYDGTAFLCAPPRLYNQIAFSVATNEVKITDVTEIARYMAVINLVMADAGLAAWTAKYHYKYARPVTAIRAIEANLPYWTPLGAPVTNGTAGSRNLTPPFPSYPSGHAVFGAAIFEAMTMLLREVEGGPTIPDEGLSFDFKSDEFNGQFYSPGGPERGDQSRHFASFSAAAAENARSRIWLGIHWQFVAVARDVVPKVFKKRMA